MTGSRIRRTEEQLDREQDTEGVDIDEREGEMEDKIRRMKSV